MSAPTSPVRSPPTPPPRPQTDSPPLDVSAPAEGDGLTPPSEPQSIDADRTQQPSPIETQAPLPPPSDPKVGELHAMFPAVEVGVVELVLESCGGSQDRAIEQLLSMTDENFKPDETHSSRTEEESQLDLDAEFARNLHFQEMESQSQQQIPYQPRARKPRAPPTQADVFGHDGEYARALQPRSQGGAGGGTGVAALNSPGMLMFEEKVEKYAEVGRQTVSTLFNRAKGAYSDFQARQAATRDADDRPQPTSWGGGPVRQDQEWRQPGGGRGGEQSRLTPTRPNQAMWAERDSNASSRSSFSSQSAAEPLTAQAAQSAPIRQSSNRWQPSDAYDEPHPPARTLSVTSPNRIDRDSPGGRRSPNVGSPPDRSGAKIDPAKLGILPKKRVDLLSTSPSTPSPAAATTGSTSSPGSSKAPPILVSAEEDEDDPNPSLPSGAAPRSLVSQIPATPPGASPYALGDSDDDLEYTKNPFDER